MKLAELIITEARERGLKHFFGLPGGGSPLDVMEVGRQLDVSFVSVAHESSAAIMAAHYGLMQNTATPVQKIKLDGIDFWVYHFHLSFRKSGESAGWTRQTRSTNRSLANPQISQMPNVIMCLITYNKGQLNPGVQ